MNLAKIIFTKNPTAIISALVVAITATEDCIAPTTASDDVANPLKLNTSLNKSTNGKISPIVSAYICLD